MSEEQKSSLDLYEEAKRKRQEEREKESQRRSFEPIEFETPVTVSIELDNPKIVRLLGNPKLARKGDPYSAKDVWISWILGDNDKNFRCVWPMKSENPNWILWKIFNKVMDGKWDNSLNGGKGAKIYKYADSHKSIFQRVSKNNDITNTMENGWSPRKYVVVNCIDRQDMSWHKEMKHTKMLCKNNYEPGMPPKLYNKIWDNIIENYGPMQNYDIAVWKSKTGPLDSDVEYNALHTSHIMEIPEKSRQFIIEGTLTEEEKSWEKYDFDKMYKITTYQKIKRNLGVFIQQVDTSFGTKFYEELEDLVTEEKKYFEKLYGNSSQSQSKKIESSSKPINEQVKVESREKPKEEKRQPLNLVSENAFNINNLNPEDYKGLSSLSEDKKKLIIGIDNDGTFIYDSNITKLLTCMSKTCDFPSPENFDYCPKCGIKF